MNNKAKHHKTFKNKNKINKYIRLDITFVETVYIRNEGSFCKQSADNQVINQLMCWSTYTVAEMVRDRRDY